MGSVCGSEFGEEADEIEGFRSGVDSRANLASDAIFDGSDETRDESRGMKQRVDGENRSRLSVGPGDASQAEMRVGFAVVPAGHEGEGSPTVFDGEPAWGEAFRGG